MDSVALIEDPVMTTIYFVHALRIQNYSEVWITVFVMADCMGPYEDYVLWLQELCADFTTAHPGYTIYPVRLNGSAVETFFSQVKHATSGHLSSVNYASARGAVLTRESIHGKMWQHRGDYRDAPLFIRQHPLKRKSYKRLKK